MIRAIGPRLETILWNVIGGFVYQALASGAGAVIVSAILDQVAHVPPTWVGAVSALVGIGIFAGLRALADRHKHTEATEPRPQPSRREDLSPSSAIRQVIGQTFENQTVVLDGARYLRCTLRHCTLQWLGGAWGGWDAGTVFDQCRYQTVAPLAIQAIDQLKGLGLLNPEFAASWGPEEVRIVAATPSKSP